MADLTAEQREQILKRLKEKGAILPCPRCGNIHFGILDGYFNQPITKDIGVVSLGGRMVPSIAVACTQCGFLSLHALGALGLMPAKGDTDEQPESAS